MRLPRARLSVRVAMLAVAAVALVLFAGKARKHRQDLAVLCGIADRGVRHTGAVYRLDHDRAALVTVIPETPARTAAEVEARRRRSAYWVALKGKYERAAAHPWLQVAPDPSPP